MFTILHYNIRLGQIILSFAAVRVLCAVKILGPAPDSINARGCRYRKLCCPTNRKSSAASDLRIKRLLKQNNAEHLASQGRGEVNSYIGSGRFSSSSPSEVAPCYAGCMCLNHPQPSDLYNALPTSSSRMSTGNGRADLGNLTSYGSRQAAPSSSNSSSADAENLPLTREKVAVPKDRTRVAPPAANGVVEDPCVAGRGRKSLGSGARRSLQRASQNSADYPHDSDPEATVV